MSKRTFAALCAATVIALVLAVVAVLSQPQFESSDKQGALLFPTLVSDADRLKSLVIRHGAETISLDWDGKAWHMRERFNYFADSAKVNEMIVTLARMAKVEGKTKLADRYSRLEVEDASGKNARGRQVTLIAADGKEIANVILGKRQYNMGTQTSNTYIRLPGDPQVWLATGEFTPDMSIGSWLDGRIADIKPTAIKRVTVTHPNGDKVVVGRESPEAQNFMIENMPKGTPSPRSGAVDEFASILTTMALENVAPAADKSFPKDKTTTAVIEGQTGFQVTLEMAEIDGQEWIRVKGVPPSANAAKPGESGIMDLRTDWNKVINELNARTEAWVYQVPDFQISPLKNSINDLIRKSQRGAAAG